MGVFDVKVVGPTGLTESKAQAAVEFHLDRENDVGGRMKILLGVGLTHPSITDRFLHDYNI